MFVVILAVIAIHDRKKRGVVGTSFYVAIALPPEYSYFNPILHPTEKSLLLIIVVRFAVVRTDSPLAKLYTTSTLEHHHFNHAVIILSTEVSDTLAVHSVLHCKDSEQSNLGGIKCSLFPPRFSLRWERSKPQYSPPANRKNSHLLGVQFFFLRKLKF